MFLMGAFGCLALKARHRQHFLTCSFACAAMQGQKNLSCMRSNMHSRPRWPTSSWHPLRATSLYAVGKTSWRRVSSNSLGQACLYRIPLLRTRWFHSCPNWLTLEGSVALDWAFPSIPSLSLVITRLRTGSTSWAWLQSLRVMLATWLLSWSTSRMCRSLLWASMELAASCTACMAAAVTLMWVLVLAGMHPGQDTLDKASASILALPAL